MAVTTLQEWSALLRQVADRAPEVDGQTLHLGVMERFVRDALALPPRDDADTLRMKSALISSPDTHANIPQAEVAFWQSRACGKALPPGFSWEKLKINIYFWRPEDAGYRFESRVIGDFLDRKFPILHIAHSDNLVRTQKRGSIRAVLNTTGHLYALSSIDGVHEDWETTGGFRCRFVDISEDGAAVMVGGRAKPGLPVKLQTELLDKPMIMSGIIKGVTFKQSKNVSVLHIQASPPSPSMKNTILMFVYGIFKDGEQRQNPRSVPPKLNS